MISYIRIWNVFTGEGKLKKIISESPVIYAHQLCRTIISNREKPILSVRQMNEIAFMLNEINIKDKKKKREHNRQVESIVKEQKRKERQLICPKCNGKLVYRKGPYGKFYGCSNFPGCRYTLKK